MFNSVQYQITPVFISIFSFKINAKTVLHYAYLPLKGYENTKYQLYMIVHYVNICIDTKF